MHEPMTSEKVIKFIDGLSISEMNKYILRGLILDLEQDISVGTYSRAYDKGDSDGRYFERANVIDEVITTLGNDYWNIAKIQQLKEQKHD